ncbi:hypothetical protein [Streptomyces sp. NPDC060194]|uniref:hypothetical protein n=1 Tax=Streptomyces sp. NPDC060194 TaxID=3347069 RepID=UPI00365D0925
MSDTPVPAPASGAGPDPRPGATAPGSAAGGPAGPADAAARRPRPALVFDDPLDRRSSDDTDRGWGERPAASGSAADLARFLDEKPPHHI